MELTKKETLVKLDQPDPTQSTNGGRIDKQTTVDCWKGGLNKFTKLYKSLRVFFFAGDK